ncbi:MAG: peptide ABC transporter substrate-binding protein [Tissierellaceae bacterium]
MKLNKYILLCISLALVLILGIACDSGIKIDDMEKDIKDITTSGQAPVEGGEVVLPLTNFGTLNPLLTDNFYYYQFSKLIFEGLFEFDKDLDVVPKLADTYSIYDNGKTISVRLKDNIKWHDGKEVTSKDVEFTISAIKYEGKNGTYGKAFESMLGAGGISNINRVVNTKIIDDKNIEIYFDKEYSNNLETLTFPIIPRHRFYDGSESKAYRNALDDKDYIPVGTGPYKFVSYEKFKTVSLEKNKNYWNGTPYIDRVIGRVLEDEELILTAFETGQINFTSTIGIDWDKYKQNNRIKVLEYISSSYEFLGFNFNNNILGGEKGSDIRKAINYGIDRQAIIQKVALGHGTQIDVPIHPNSYLVSNIGNTYGYNVEKAKMILTDAGFRDSDGDGILEDEQGNRLSFKLVTNSYNIYRLRMAEMISEYLKELGIEIRMDLDTSFKENISEKMKLEQWEAINAKIKKGDFDIALLGWETSITPDLFSMFHSSQINGGNFIRIKSEEMDGLIDEILYITNREEKVQRYEKLQEFIIDELPYVSLFFKNKGLLMDTKIAGPLDPNFFNLYNGLENCFIPEDLQ